jgi:hypothetical protein
MPTWKPSYPKNKPFKCCVAWHLWKSGQLLAIYDFLGGITKGGETHFFSSIRQVSVYFGMNYESTRRSFKVLRAKGWIERLADGNHRYVTHDEWERSHPGKCAKRELLPWQESANPFVGKIWAVSGGKILLQEWQIREFGKYVTDEQLFIGEFQKEMDAAKARQVPGGDWSGTSPKACYMRAFNRFKEGAATVGIPAHQ